MLMRTSLPRSAARPPLRACARARARAATLYFRAKIPPLAGTEHRVEIVCKASYTRRFSFSASRLLLSPLLPLSAFHPRNLSRLCGGGDDGIRSAGNEKKEKKEKKSEEEQKRRNGSAILSSRLDHPVSTFASGRARSDAMKKSHGSMQRKRGRQHVAFRPRRSNGSRQRIAERLRWKRGTVGEPSRRDSERKSQQRERERERERESWRERARVSRCAKSAIYGHVHVSTSSNDE